MITTLRTNIKNPVRRKMLYARIGGKMIGLAAVIGMIYAFAYLFSTQVASATPVHSAATDLKAQLTTSINATQHRLGLRHRIPGVLHASRAS